MRTWLMTNTFFGTWLPGDSRGSVTRVRERRVDDAPGEVRLLHDVPGTPCEEEMPGLRRVALEQMSGPSIYLDREKAKVLLAQLLETSSYRGHRMLAVAIMANHLHFVVEVPDDPDPHRLLSDYKAYGSRALNRQFGEPMSKTWWTTNGSKRKLANETAVIAACQYVLKQQPNPLLVWPTLNDSENGEPTTVPGEPGASATGVPHEPTGVRP